MAYAQWVSIEIKSVGTTLSIKNAQHAWGKFFQCGDKDKEVSVDDINKITIPSGGVVSICACGRENASSGTEGSIDIYDGDVLVGTYYWDCPWGSKRNISTWTPSGSDDHITQVTGGNLDSGAIGNIYIKCVRI